MLFHPIQLNSLLNAQDLNFAIKSNVDGHSISIVVYFHIFLENFIISRNAEKHFSVILQIGFVQV